LPCSNVLVSHIGLHILRLIKLANDFAKVKITTINILLLVDKLPKAMA